MSEIWYIPEPRCVFGYGQSMEHPKDGLTAFGPVHDPRQPKDMRVGAIGTPDGLRYFRQWVGSIQGPVEVTKKDDPKQSLFPGFSATFRCNWAEDPIASIEIDPKEIEEALRHADGHQRIYNTVSLYESRIAQYVNEEDYPVSVWFVIIPEAIYERGRPKSQVPKGERTHQDEVLSRKQAKTLTTAPFFPFLDALNKGAEMHRYARDFRDQLKGRLLATRAVVQVVRETTLAPHAFTRSNGQPFRNLQDPADLVWNLATGAFYKAGGQPWRLDGIRPGVCYLGMVYKRLDENSGTQACCGAQMFLSGGDGLVFKGAIGDWYSDDTREFHLDADHAEALMRKAIAAYRAQHNEDPREVFIHGRARFNEAEWTGFERAVPPTTTLVGVRIKRHNLRKLYRGDKYTALRGLALPFSDKSGLLWSLGFVPRLQTYQGREVPNPLLIDICRGTADLRTVMADVLALTKVNFNACIYGDGIPVTLRFADRVGRVLTAIPPELDPPPLPFRHYI